MGYWFTNPMLKSLLPVTSSTSVIGLSKTFGTPQIFMGANLLPEKGRGPMDQIAARCPKKRAFIVTDEIAERFAKRVEKALVKTGFTVCIWNKAQPEVPMENAFESAAAMTEFEPDLIVGVGGGSALDGAKAGWLLYERPDFKDLREVSPMVPLNLRKKAILAAIPTTSGTGSEVTMVSVIHDTEGHRKFPIASPELMPDYALLIPEFTYSVPPKLTVGTGLDVLAHSMDCVPTTASNEITDALALAATEMVFKWLPRAYRNGNDREARYRMIMASSIAGIAFGQGGVALSHAFGHSLGAVFHIHHGLACGIFIPYVLQYYAPVTDKWLPLARNLDVMGKTTEESLANLVARIKALYAELDVPVSLKDLGIERDQFEERIKDLVQFAVEDFQSFVSPRPLTEKQCEMIWRYVYEGKDIDF